MLNVILQKIPLHIKLLLKIYLMGVIIFMTYRVIFLFYNSSLSISEYENDLLFKSFLSGLRFDTSIICYALAIPCILLCISHFMNHRHHGIINFTNVFFIVIFAFYQFIWAADIPYYKQFGNHLNMNALLWKDENKFMFRFIFENIAYWGFLVLFFAITIISYFVFSYFFKIFKQQIKNNYQQKPFIQVIQFISIGLFVFLGLRGTTSKKTTLHEGFAITCSNTFINNVGLNPNFTFLQSILKSKNADTYTIPKTINADIDFTRKYLGIYTPFELNVNRVYKSTDSIKPYNVVIVMMESMSTSKMGYYGHPNLTPNLHKLNKESVFCENFFSSGIHTFNGLFSTISGFPSIYHEQGLKRYTNTSFDGIGTMLKNAGYDTYFGTTHDSQFDNMEGFFRINHFDHIINQSTMPSNKVISALGVADHVLFDEFVSQINERKSTTPFLGVLMTATDHGPWIIPKDIPFKPNGKNQEDNCTLYADWAIGRFLDRVKKQPWYNNTVFVFLGDHGLYLDQTYEMSICYNHIPCIIHQPNLFKADTITSPCYQPDISATVMGILGLSFTNKTFGINILKEKHPYVVFSADDKIACVDDKGFFYYKTLSNGEEYLRKYKNLDPINYNVHLKSKTDSLAQNSMRIYEAARYFIRKYYYTYE